MITVSAITSDSVETTRFLRVSSFYRERKSVISNGNTPKSLVVSVHTDSALSQRVAVERNIATVRRPPASLPSPYDLSGPIMRLFRQAVEPIYTRLLAGLVGRVHAGVSPLSEVGKVLGKVRA